MYRYIYVLAHITMKLEVWWLVGWLVGWFAGPIMITPTIELGVLLHTYLQAKLESHSII